MKVSYNMMKKLANIISLILMMFMQSGCTVAELGDSLASNIPIINYFTGCNYCTVKIRSSKNTNQGAPFYLVVKATDFPSFLSENYNEIAHLLDTPPKEESCFEIYCIVPGKDQMFTIERPPEACSLGFYFLFTNPGNIWKQIVEIIDGTPVIRIVLDRNEVISVG
jgi:hypothetical protein